MCDLNFVRRIDGQGRVTLPQDLRTMLGLKLGDEVEFFVEKNGDVKFSANGKNKDSLTTILPYIEQLGQTLGRDVLVCSKRKVLGGSVPDLQGCGISDVLYQQFNTVNIPRDILTPFHLLQDSDRQALGAFFFLLYDKTPCFLAVLGGLTASEELADGEIALVRYTLKILESKTV